MNIREIYQSGLCVQTTDIRGLKAKKTFAKIFCALVMCYSAVSASSIAISEVAWMGTTASSYDEWIELQNFGDEAVDLTGWKLVSEDGSPEISLSGMLSPRKFHLLERTDDTTTSVAADQIYTGSLSNAGESLQLFDASNNLIDQTPSGTWAAGESSSKKSMERVDPRISGFDKNNWDTFSARVVQSLGDGGENSNFQDAGNGELLGSPKAQNSVGVILPALEKIEIQTTAAVVITEIAPARIGDDTEWFEFMILADQPVDLTDWTIVRGNYRKNIGNLVNEIHWNETDFLPLRHGFGGQAHGNLAGTTIGTVSIPSDRLVLWPQTLDELTGKFRGILYFPTSPVSLPDTGGTLEIFDGDGKSLDTVSYPKTKKGTRNKIPYGEVWQRDRSDDTVFPQLVEAGNQNFQHSQGRKNSADFFDPNGLEIVLSEVSANHDQKDFLELFVASALPDSNLQSFQIIYNGRELLFVGEKIPVSTGDYLFLHLGEARPWEKKNHQIHFYTDDLTGLSTTSGTLEINLYGRTSQKISADFFCWYQEIMSKTQLSRVKKVGENWSGACFRNPKWTKNLSLARNNDWGDTNSKTDWFAHFIGSPGFPNQRISVFNLPPQAVIDFQGRIAATGGFNVTGERSRDPNGDHDIVNYAWKYELKAPNQKNSAENFSRKENPLLFKLEQHQDLPAKVCQESHYKITLTVTDHSGSLGKKSKKLPLRWNGKQCELDPERRFYREIIVDRNTQKNSAENLNEVAFFADFLAVYKPNNSKQSKPPNAIPARNQSVKNPRKLFHDSVSKRRNPIRSDLKKKMNGNRIFSDQSSHAIIQKNIAWVVWPDSILPGSEKIE